MPDIHLFLTATHARNKCCSVKHSIDHIPSAVHPVVNQDLVVVKPSCLFLFKEDGSFLMPNRAWHFQECLSIFAVYLHWPPVCIPAHGVRLVGVIFWYSTNKECLFAICVALKPRRIAGRRARRGRGARHLGRRNAPR